MPPHPLPSNAQAAGVDSVLITRIIWRDEGAVKVSVRYGTSPGNTPFEEHPTSSTKTITIPNAEVLDPYIEDASGTGIARFRDAVAAYADENGLWHSSPTGEGQAGG